MPNGNTKTATAKQPPVKKQLRGLSRQDWTILKDEAKKKGTNVISKKDIQARRSSPPNTGLSKSDWAILKDEAKRKGTNAISKNEILEYRGVKIKQQSPKTSKPKPSAPVDRTIASYPKKKGM